MNGTAHRWARAVLPAILLLQVVLGGCTPPRKAPLTVALPSGLLHLASSVDSTWAGAVYGKAEGAQTVILLDREGRTRFTRQVTASPGLRVFDDALGYSVYHLPDSEIEVVRFPGGKPPGQPYTAKAPGTHHVTSDARWLLLEDASRQRLDLIELQSRKTVWSHGCDVWYACLSPDGSFAMVLEKSGLLKCIGRNGAIAWTVDAGSAMEMDLELCDAGFVLVDHTELRLTAFDYAGTRRWQRAFSTSIEAVRSLPGGSVLVAWGKDSQLFVELVDPRGLTLWRRELQDWDPTRGTGETVPWSTAGAT